MNILITDGNCRSALAVTRSLGIMGCYVLVGDEIPNNLSAASKHCSKKIVYPSPYTEQRRFLDAIHEIIRTNNIDSILPISDVTMDVILRSSEEFSEKLLRLLPSYRSYSLLTNKISLMQLAVQSGVAVPHSIFIDTKDRFMEISESIKFPVIIKPALSRLFQNGRYIMTSVSNVESREQLMWLCKDRDYLRRPFIVQEKIQGYGAGVFALFRRGNAAAYFSHKRLREKPPSGGVSVLCESIPLDETMKKATEIILKAVDWNGVAMAEFKVDEKTRTPYLMEVNGRFWGSLQLAIDAGIDFPRLLCTLPEGSSECSEMTHSSYTIGKKSRWLLGDIDHLYIRLFKKRGNEGLPADILSKMQAIMDFVKYNGDKCSFDVCRSNDITPCVVELKQYLNHLMSFWHRHVEKQRP